MEAPRIRRRNRESAHNIPNDIMHDILLRLPAKSLLRFKAVCKSWRDLLSDPGFKKSHIKLANKSCDIVSYCQFSEGHERPDTASLTFINRDALETETVKIRNPFNCSDRDDDVKILGSYVITYEGSGITVNGVSHWVVWFPKEKHAPNAPMYRTIIYFDMVEEKFKRLPTPTSWFNSRESVVTVGVLRGCLCTTLYKSRNDCYDVWVMKEYGVKESYTKLFAIPMRRAGRLTPLGFTKNSDEVVLHLSWKGLVAYNLNTQEEKSIFSTIEASDGLLVVESLISPGESNEEKKHTVREEKKN